MGLALFFLAALLWGLQGATPAHADPGTLYVDGATGSDTTDCTNPAAPCETIGYALTQAVNGDEIRVAEETYTETLDIGITVTLKGGYEATGWTRDIAAHPTIVDANGADSPVICIYPDADVTVESFTVEGGNHTSGNGGGFWVISATVSISDTVIRENSANEGGGVFIEGDSNVSLINSTITSNTVSAAYGTSGFSGGTRGHVLIQNTVFAENTGDCVLNFESGQPFEITGGQVVSNTVSGFRTIGLSGSGTISGTAVLSNTSAAIA
ncbi:MAG: right-handed parallel beta-helix repeat-containing protein, partial [Chloroflexota bacterium]|nr:right-handed parallel beta-helix repeat-containing protein [Chloroflexota bacterium]